MFLLTFLRTCALLTPILLCDVAVLMAPFHKPLPLLKTVASLKMKEKESMLCTEEQRCCYLRCIIHEKVTNSICDPGNKSEVGKQGKDSQQDPLKAACKDAARARELIQKANFDGKLDTRHLDHQWDHTAKPVQPGLLYLSVHT